jgi:hypothetical protein
VPPKKRQHPRTGPDSWQNTDGRESVNRTKAGGDGPAAKERNQEAYLDHPTDDKGRKICFAKIGKNKHCQLDAGRGTNHPNFGKCSLHGGNTPTLEINAAMYAGGEVVKQMTKGFGAPPPKLDPHEALLQEVANSFGIVAFLRQRLDMYDLELGEKVLDPAKKELVELYDKQRTMAVRTAKMAIDAGIAEQRVAMERAKGMLLVDVLKEVFAGLNLSVEQQKLLPLLVPAALRRLTEPEFTPIADPPALPGG